MTKKFILIFSISLVIGIAWLLVFVFNLNIVQADLILVTSINASDSTGCSGSGNIIETKTVKGQVIEYCKRSEEGETNPYQFRIDQLGDYTLEIEAANDKDRIFNLTEIEKQKLMVVYYKDYYSIDL